MAFARIMSEGCIVGPPSLGCTRIRATVDILRVRLRTAVRERLASTHEGWLAVRSSRVCWSVSVAHLRAARYGGQPSPVRDVSSPVLPKDGLPTEARSASVPRAKVGTGTGIRTPVPWLRNAAGGVDGSGCVGFLGVFALTFGLCRSSPARFVRKVSRILQVSGLTPRGAGSETALCVGCCHATRQGRLLEDLLQARTR